MEKVRASYFEEWLHCSNYYMHSHLSWCISFYCETKTTCFAFECQRVSTVMFTFVRPNSFCSKSVREVDVALSKHCSDAHSILALQNARKTFYCNCIKMSFRFVSMSFVICHIIMWTRNICLLLISAFQGTFCIIFTTFNTGISEINLLYGL